MLRSRGVGYGGQSPPPLIGPIFFIIFTKTLPKRQADAYPLRYCTLKTLSFGNSWPQNPFLRPVLAMPLLGSNQTLGEYRMKVLKYDYKYKFMLALFWHELAKVFMNKYSNTNINILSLEE